jgi:hypothetical protein
MAAQMAVNSQETVVESIALTSLHPLTDGSSGPAAYRQLASDLRSSIAAGGTRRESGCRRKCMCRWS